MKWGYVVQKGIRKLLNRPCINNSVLDKTSRVDIGSVIIQSSIGRYSYVGEHTSLLYAKVGVFTCISNYCAIGGGSHPMEWVSMSPVFNKTQGIIIKKLGYLEYEPFEKTYIENDVWIGSHCLIKSGVKISDGAVIGMGSVVVKDIGPYEIWAGNPAKFIRKRFDDETITYLQNSRWWEWEDVKIAACAELFSSPRQFLNYMENEGK